MKLTEQDKQTLRTWGYRESDMKQIERATIECWFTNEKDERISAEEAIEMLGREEWLSGIGRAAFHATAGRGTKGKNYVSFDCYEMLFG